ncbi:MAG: hypothetical protein WBD47_19780 [Phormidesmis sp.]
MSDTVQLTVDWREAESDVSEAQQEAITQTLFQELRRSDAVETVARIRDPEMPAGSMGAHWLWSILTAEIPGNGIKLACQEVFERLPGKPIDFALEVNGRKIEVKNVRPDDIDSITNTLV